MYVNEVPYCTAIPAQVTVIATPPTPTLLAAGEDPLRSFQVVFLSTIYVSQPADIAFNIEFDDGFIWGIGPLDGVSNGPQPEFISGTFNPPPPSSPTPWPTTAFRNYLVASQFTAGYGQGPVTVRFPAAGFYPIEMDYAEDGVGGLNITLEDPTGTPLSSGPSPTPTSTCYAPTPVPSWPWCPLSPTPTSAPSPPGYTSSYYVQVTNTPESGATATPTSQPDIWYTKGAKQADKMISSGPVYGVVILDFGKPWFNYYDPQIPDRDAWGTKTIPPCRGCSMYYLSSTEIADIAIQYAEGFAYEAQKSSSTHQPSIRLAIGTTNFVDTANPPILTADEFHRHGQHWGALVNGLSSTLWNLSPWVTFEGADDIEFSWSDEEHTLRWTQGFEEVTRGDSANLPRYYYSYSDCTACYPAVSDPNETRLCPADAPWCWDIDAAEAANWGNRYNAPVNSDQGLRQGGL